MGEPGRPHQVRDRHGLQAGKDFRREHVRLLWLVSMLESPFEELLSAEALRVATFGGGIVVDWLIARSKDRVAAEEVDRHALDRRHVDERLSEL